MKCRWEGENDVITSKTDYRFLCGWFSFHDNGIWSGGLGTVLVGLAVFFTAGFNNTAFYPSKAALQSSLTIYNASSSHYTLTAMSYVALMIPLVMAYVVYVWYLMNAKKISAAEVTGKQADEMY